MANYVLRNFKSKNPNIKNTKSTNLLDIGAIDLNTGNSIIKSSLAIGQSETTLMAMNQNSSLINNFQNEFFDNYYTKYRDISKISGEFVAFFDQSYPLRREYLRQFSQNGEINFVLETITDEAIVYNNDKYFADVDMSKLKSKLNKDFKEADKLIKITNQSFKHVYQSWGWDQSNDAWDYFKKFLIEGFLAFEIIYNYDKENNAVSIKAFKELDPITLEPAIVKNPNGEEVKIWYQFKDDPQLQHIIPDTNLIYISWANGNFIDNTRVSYLEGLTRSFNMLRQLENARIIWNIQNAQKRIKMIVPVGTMNIDKARQRISELQAEYNEDTEIDNYSGEITINGQPKFSFMKTYVFPQINDSVTEISEMGVEGYDMNSVEQLKYFWRRFILETKVPANRFTLDPTGAPQNPLNGDSAITREEYAFNRFILRIQSIFKELLLKPLWIQICLKMPSLKYANAIKSLLNINFNEENIFVSQKEQSILNQGAQTVGTLAGIQGADGKPIFSPEFLTKKFLDISDEDWELNKKYKESELLRAAKEAKENAEAQQVQEENPAPLGGGLGGGMDMGLGGGDMGDMSGGMDMGLGGGEATDMGDMSGGMDMGSGDMSGGGMDMSGGDMGGAPEI